MKLVNIHQFDPVIYPIKLWVTITDDKHSLSERFRNGYNDNDIDTQFIDLSEAVTYYVQQKENPTYYGVLIVFSKRKYCSIKNIVHESSHAIDFIFRHINETNPGDESKAYLIGWIGKCIYESINYKSSKNDK